MDSLAATYLNRKADEVRALAQEHTEADSVLRTMFELHASALEDVAVALTLPELEQEEKPA